MLMQNVSHFSQQLLPFPKNLSYAQLLHFHEYFSLSLFQPFVFYLQIKAVAIP